MYIYVPHACLQKPRKGPRATETRVRDVLSHQMSAGNQPRSTGEGLLPLTTEPSI